MAGQPVGVDIERTRRREASLAAYLLDGRERLLLANCTPADEVVTRAWTVKESVLKLLGTGLRVHPRGMRIDVRVRSGFVVDADAVGCHDRVHVRSLRAGDFWIAIAAYRPIPSGTTIGWHRPRRLPAAS